MSKHPYDPNCPSCKPALVDTSTGKPFADDSPEMKAVMAAWAELPFEEREAYIAMTVLMRTDPATMLLTRRATERIIAALKALHTQP